MNEHPKTSKFWLNNRRGQVGLIIILVVAFSLIFYAAAMNLGKISQTKTQTQIASMAGASQLASQMSSYGQYLFQTQLGGKKRVCAPSGVLMAVIVVVIVIILIIITIISAGAAGGAWAALAGVIGIVGEAAVTAFTAVVLTVSLLMAVASLVLQVAVIQPGLTRMWNKIIQDTMGIQDQFSEQGILAGLQNVVTDNKAVPDLHDFDNDLIWGFDSDGKPKDRINRFGYYYSEKRLKKVVVPELPALDRFFNELRDFVYQTPTAPYGDPNESPKWGLYDPVDCSTNPNHECCYNAAIDPNKKIPSYCNPCCVSGNLPNPLEDPNVPGDEFVSARPSCCDCYDPAHPGKGCPPEEQCGVSKFCAEMSPYGADYPYVYDRYWENDYNNYARKRVQIVPTQDESVLTLDGKTKMPVDPASTQLNIKYFDSHVDTCAAAIPSTGLIQVKTKGPVSSFGWVYYPSSNWKIAGCPKGFVERNGGTANEEEKYSGYCNGPIKLSKVKMFDLLTFCDGIEQPPQSFISFREALGTDDENRLYTKDPYHPNRKQIKLPPDKVGFKLSDASGYYAEPEYLASDFDPDFDPSPPREPDLRKGIYPFFYKISDWGLDLNKLNQADYLAKHPENCYWFDKRTNPCPTDIAVHPFGLRPQLELPLDPADPASGLVYNTTDHVDFESIAGKPALRPDRVSLPNENPNHQVNPYREIVASEDFCAQEMFPLNSNAQDKDGFWKRGAERFCQDPGNETNWPYYAHCAKHNWKPDGGGCFETDPNADTDGDGKHDSEDVDERTPIDCYCSYYDGKLTNEGDYPEDVLDDIRYGMNDFLDLTRVLFRKWESQF